MTMKLFRYRRPSVSTLLGITRVKRAVRKATGTSTFQRYTKPSRIKQRIKQKTKIYSPPMTVARQTSRGKFPSLFGLFGRRRVESQEVV